MECLYEYILKINDKWDIDEARSVFQKGQKSAFKPLLKEQLIDIIILMCKALTEQEIDVMGEENTENMTTAPTEDAKESSKRTPIDGELNDVNIVTNKNVINMKSKGVCRAYKQRVCSFGKKGEGCPFAHPPKCQTFCDFGLSKFNPNGCDQTKCNLLHPNLCKKAIKDGTCFKKDCKYHHFKGTKRTPPKTNTTNFNHQIPPKTNTTNINYPTPPKTNTTNFNYPPPVPPPQTLNSQQDTDKMTSFLLTEVGKLMEKLEKRVEDRLGSIFPHLQITPTKVSQLQPPTPPQFQHSQPPQTFRTPQVSQPQFFQPPAMYQHPNPH